MNEDRKHFLDDSNNIDRIWRLFVICCVVVAALDLLGVIGLGWHRHVSLFCRRSARFLSGMGIRRNRIAHHACQTSAAHRYAARRTTTMATELPPFVIFAAGGLLALLTRGQIRAAIMLAIPVVSGISLLGFEPGSSIQWQILGYTLSPFRVDALSLLFGYLFHIGAFIAILYALHLKDTLQHTAALLYAGSALGAVFAGDVISFFIFWEILAVSSVFLIWGPADARCHQGRVSISDFADFVGCYVYWRDC